LHIAAHFMASLGTRRALVYVLLASALLATGSLGAERSLDDWIIGSITQGRGVELGIARPRLEAFRFTTGDQRENQRLMDAGVMLPWWSDPRLKVGFLRPLSALSHCVDQALWPESGLLMHVHCLVWFVFLMLCVCYAYRRLENSRCIAGLAFLLYALDDAHGATLGWIANRNAFMAASFGCLALAMHDRYRRGKARGAAALALLCFAAALTASELAVGALGYLIAYALFLDPASRKARLWSLVPYLLLCLGFRGISASLGYGASGSGAYIDPLTDSARFLAHAPLRWLCLLQGQLGLIPAEFSLLEPRAGQALSLCLALFTSISVAWLLAPQIRSAESRFWLTGMLLSLLPMAATLPHDRLLLFVGLGAMPLVARLLVAVTLPPLTPTRGSVRVRRWGAVALGIVHLVWAPLLFPLRAAQMNVLAQVEARAWRRPFAEAALVKKTWVVLSSPSLLLANYALPRRLWLGLPSPHRILVLAATGGAVQVMRSGPSALTLTPELGFLSTPLEEHYRTPAHSLGLGETVRLSTFDAEVVRTTSDGRPASVRFAFHQPLEQLVFLCWQGTGFEPCALPALGEARALPKVAFGSLLLRATFDPESLASKWATLGDKITSVKEAISRERSGETAASSKWATIVARLFSWCACAGDTPQLQPSQHTQSEIRPTRAEEANESSPMLYLRSPSSHCGC
jgi:hypothetical protein